MVVRVPPSHGFDAVEILPRSADEVDAAELRTLLASHGLSVAAFGTGAGWIVRKLSLTAADEAVRTQARKFIGAIIDLAGSFGAPGDYWVDARTPGTASRSRASPPLVPRGAE